MSRDHKQQSRAPTVKDRVKVDGEDAPYWCRKLGCTEAALRSALKSVGPLAEDVERHLKQARRR